MQTLWTTFSILTGQVTQPDTVQPDVAAPAPGLPHPTAALEASVRRMALHTPRSHSGANSPHGHTKGDGVLFTPASDLARSVSDGCDMLDGLSEDEFVQVPSALQPPCPYPMVPRSSQALVAAELAAARHLGLGAAAISVENASLCLHFDVTALPLYARVTGGWTAQEPLVVRFDVRRGYRRASPAPSYTITQGARTLVQAGVAGPSADAASVVAYKLARDIAGHMDAHWCTRDALFLSEVYTLVQQRLAQPGAHCGLCDTPLTDDPTVLNFCDAAPCRQGYSKLRAQPSFFSSTVASAAASTYFAMAAAWLHARPAKFFPAKGLRPLTAQGQPIATEVAQHALAALGACAPHDVLPHPRALLACAAPHATDVLQWVFASRPAVLMPLTQSERFAQIATPMQFLVSPVSRQESQMMADSRRNETTRFGFFTAPFSQWHMLLREGFNAWHDAQPPGMLWQDAQAALVAVYGQRERGKQRAAHSPQRTPYFALGVCEVPCAQDAVEPAPLYAHHAGPALLRFLFVYDANACKKQKRCAIDALSWPKS